MDVSEQLSRRTKRHVDLTKIAEYWLKCERHFHGLARRKAKARVRLVSGLICHHGMHVDTHAVPREYLQRLMACGRLSITCGCRLDEEQVSDLERRLLDRIYKAYASRTA